MNSSKGNGMANGSVSAWLQQLKVGEEEALGRLHARYWPVVVSMARKKLGDVPGRLVDREDVAQEAFWGFYRSLKAGRLPRLRDRHDLLALLSHIVACKAVNQLDRELGTQKRGAGRVREQAGDGGQVRVAVADDGRTPLEQALLNDCYRHYVAGLPDALRACAEYYLAGYTHPEIAERLGCVQRTVDRKLALILEKWQEMAAADVVS